MSPLSRVGTFCFSLSVCVCERHTDTGYWMTETQLLPVTDKRHQTARCGCSSSNFIAESRGKIVQPQRKEKGRNHTTRSLNASLSTVSLITSFCCICSPLGGTDEFAREHYFLCESVTQQFRWKRGDSNCTHGWAKVLIRG